MGSYQMVHYVSLQKKNTGDYHYEINGDNFKEWFESILPRLDPNSIIVIYKWGIILPKKKNIRQRIRRKLKYWSGSCYGTFYHTYAIKTVLLRNNK